MKWKIATQESRMQLLTFLKNKLPYSRKKLKQALDANLCIVNGAVERFGTVLLKPGDWVDLDLKKMDIFLSEVPTQTFEIEPSRILYEDETILIYDKPSGISSDEKGLSKLFKDYLLIHRLDKDTTGIILFAKSEKIRKYFIELFKQQAVKKEYLAIVDGTPQENSGVIENFLGKLHSYDGQSIWGSVRPGQGKEAQTKWKCKKRGKKASLIQCFPLSGRTHQIRAHLKGLGHPILGDYQYARIFRCPFHPSRCMLHAHKLSFSHPKTGKLLTFAAPIPADFEEVMKKVL